MVSFDTFAVNSLVILGQDGSESSVVRFLPIDPVMSGSNPPSTKASLRVRIITSSWHF